MDEDFDIDESPNLSCMVSDCSGKLSEQPNHTKTGYDDLGNPTWQLDVWYCPICGTEHDYTWVWGTT